MPTRMSRRARLREAKLVDFYGARCWDITYTTDESPGELRYARLGAESVYEDPQPGDLVLITFLANNATRVYRTD